MEKKKSSRPSLGDVAKAAGISKAAVCYALQNRPKVSAATRRRVLRIARQLGYAPDARLATWMTKVRETKAKDLLPIAWLNTYRDKNAWHDSKFLWPYLEGAQKQAMQSGYRLEEIWTQQPGIAMRRISQILYQRGIEGVIISYPARHFRLNWDHLAGVSLGTGLLAPHLHQVAPDVHFNFVLALKMVKRFGYRRIGVCLDEMLDRRYANHAIRHTTHHLNALAPPKERVLPLFYDWPVGGEKAATDQAVQWIRQERPDVIVCHSSLVVDWVKAAGFRVPQDIGVVHLAVEDDVQDWAGICSNKREIGADAVKLVVSLLQSREFGLPKIAMNASIRGTWQPGRTLLIPKPK